jgi:ATP-dependent Lon protease
LPVGGIKDKLLAAFRTEILEIIIPRENEKDLEDIPAEVRSLLTIHLVDSMDEVLTIALDGEIKPLSENKEKFAPVPADPVSSGSIAH